jgi:hypothetical protein
MEEETHSGRSKSQKLIAVFVKLKEYGLAKIVRMGFTQY